MKTTQIKSALSHFVNDWTDVQEYGGSFLVTMPINYYDGDATVLRIEYVNERMIRISDDGETAQRLMMSGVNLDTPAMEELWSSAFGQRRNLDIGHKEGVLAVVVPVDELGAALVELAETCIRIDQLHLHAKTSVAVPFADRVGQQALQTFNSLAPAGIELHTRARVPVPSGRERQVTAGLWSMNAWVGVIQALGGRNRETRGHQLDRTYATFDQLEDIPRESRIAVLEGHESDWEHFMVTEVRRVGTPIFFAEERALENVMRGALKRRGLATA